MSDISTVNFTITNFNEEEKQLDVVFNDGSWAKIQLKDPLPTNQTELEDIVKQFTTPHEVFIIKKANTDLSFIHSLVNQDIETTRHSLNNVRLADGSILSNSENPQNMALPDAKIMMQIRKNQELQSQSDMANTLISFGLLKENPVDLSQIIDVTSEIANNTTQPISTGTQTL